MFKSKFINIQGYQIQKEYLLSDICSFIKGKKPIEIIENKKENFLPYLTIEALNTGVSLYANPHNTVIVDVLDVLMVMDGASSGTSYFGGKGIVGSTIAKLEVKEYGLLDVVYQFVKYYENDIKKHTTGSAIPHTDKSFILNLKLNLPFEVENYTKTFSEMRNHIIKNNVENNNLSELRDTLLPKLMSGEISVEEIEV